MSIHKVLFVSMDDAKKLILTDLLDSNATISNKDYTEEYFYRTETFTRILQYFDAHNIWDKIFADNKVHNILLQGYSTSEIYLCEK